MRTKQTTQISVFHTPDKASKPDLKHQSHLKTTVPSVYEVSPQQQKTSQFGTHYSKMRNYQSMSAPLQSQSSQKKVSKNQWELKQKVDEYESQIGLLRQYLQSSQCVEKCSISRIFGFPQQKNSLSRQQQRVIKQLGSKVKGLVRENASLKSQNAHYSQLNIDQIILQNEKLQLMVQQYKRDDDKKLSNQIVSNINNGNRLLQQNELLRDELYRQQLQHQQRVRQIQVDNETKLKILRNKQIQLLNKIKQLQQKLQSQQLIQQHQSLPSSIIRRSATTTNKKQQIQHLNNIEEIEKAHTNNILQQQLFYKHQLQQQQKYYQQQNISTEIQIKQLSTNLKQKQLHVKELQQKLEQLQIKLQQQLRNQQQLEQQLQTVQHTNQLQLQKTKKYYSNTIQDIDTKHYQRINQLTKLLNMLQQRLMNTDQSIQHLKFQRNNRIQSTIKKSHNLAYSSIKPKGELHQQQPVIEQILEEQIKINTKPLSYSVNPQENKLVGHQINILKEKIKYLQKELQEMQLKLSLNEKINMEKTQRIITLENQIRNLNNKVSSLNYNLKQSNNQQPIIKQIIKQVPVHTILQPATIPKQYSQQVKQIKQTIISCNLNNFDTFQNQFHQIIQQRNLLNQKMVALKKQAKQSSKVLILEKHLKVERQRNKYLEDSLKKYQKQIENLKIQVIELKTQIQNMHHSNEPITQMTQEQSKVSFQHLPDGKAGLEWQKVVKHCLMTSINRLQNLQNRMKQDIGQNNQ